MTQGKIGQTCLVMPDRDPTETAGPPCQVVRLPLDQPLTRILRFPANPRQANSPSTPAPNNHRESGSGTATRTPLNWKSLTQCRLG